MTRVCLVGNEDVNLQYELLSRETSREALATYDLQRPYENTLAVRTVSIGAAVSLLNDLNWYLTRFVEESLVQEPSVSDDEWLSRPLARKLRNGELEADETAEYCKIYGLEPVETGDPETGDEERERRSNEPTRESGSESSRIGSADDDSEEVEGETGGETDRSIRSGPTHRLVEPLFVRRTDGGLPEYDLREVDETLVVRLTEAEYSP